MQAPDRTRWVNSETARSWSGRPYRLLWAEPAGVPERRISAHRRCLSAAFGWVEVSPMSWDTLSTMSRDRTKPLYGASPRMSSPRMSSPRSVAESGSWGSRRPACGRRLAAPSSPGAPRGKTRQRWCKLSGSSVRSDHGHHGQYDGGDRQPRCGDDQPERDLRCPLRRSRRPLRGESCSCRERTLDLRPVRRAARVGRCRSVTDALYVVRPQIVRNAHRYNCTTPALHPGSEGADPGV